MPQHKAQQREAVGLHPLLPQRAQQGRHLRLPVPLVPQRVQQHQAQPVLRYPWAAHQRRHRVIVRRGCGRLAGHLLLHSRHCHQPPPLHRVAQLAHQRDMLVCDALLVAVLWQVLYKVGHLVDGLELSGAAVLAAGQAEAGAAQDRAPDGGDQERQRSNVKSL